jgi:hypothetical protein
MTIQSGCAGTAGGASTAACICAGVGATAGNGTDATDSPVETKIKTLLSYKNKYSGNCSIEGINISEE